MKLKSPIRHRVLFDTSGATFAMLFAIAVGIGMGYGVMYEEALHPPESRQPLVIVQRIRAWRYAFWQPGDADCFVHDLCPDGPEPLNDFKPRVILDHFVYRNLDDTPKQCWSINPDFHAGYHKRRDRKTKDFVTYTGPLPDTDTCAVE